MLSEVESFSSKFTSFFSSFPINFIPKSGNYNLIPKSGNNNSVLNTLFLSSDRITVDLITSNEKSEESANEKSEDQKKKKKNGADDVNKGINFIQVSY